MGILGGISATISNLSYLVNTAKEAFGNNFTWSACAAGRHQIPICTQALLLGGNVRVGLEDSVFLSKGRLATSNGEQVAKIVRIMAELDLSPATPAEAREILGLKGLDKVNY
jgi:uncharacterized protein (DUF849 family)